MEVVNVCYYESNILLIIKISVLFKKRFLARIPKFITTKFIYELQTYF